MRTGYFSSKRAPGVQGLRSEALGEAYDKIDVELTHEEFEDPEIRRWIREVLFTRLAGPPFIAKIWLVQG